MAKLAQKVALITGGGGGIGRATALAFAAEGATVVVCDIAAAAAEAVAAELTANFGAGADSRASTGAQAIAIAADVSRDDQVSALIAQIVARFGRLDIAFNNAAIDVEHEPLDRCSEETFDDLMRVNVKGVWLCMKYEIEQMLKQGSGAIVNTSSIAGLNGAPRQPIYAATKHAIVGLTKSAALEYGRKGIRVNAVCPGVIRTQMMERALARDPRRQVRVERIHPIGRVGEAEEIARAVVFLSSDDATFVLGHALAVDGGYTAT